MDPLKQRIILLGPPASGKGTQADLLSEEFNIPHVSTGALLRSEHMRRTPLGREADEWTSRGMLVPDELAVRIVSSWMQEHGTNFIFDGFPRTVAQAKFLDAALAVMKAPLELVVLLEISDEVIRHRIKERLSCLKCGATYSVSLHGLQEGASCPRCSAPLVRRNDDTAEALTQRLDVYRNLTLPVVAYYELTAPQILHRIEAGKESADIFERLVQLVMQSSDINPNSEVLGAI